MDTLPLCLAALVALAAPNARPRRRRRRPFTVATHNMTEGAVTAAVRACDIILGQEVARSRIIAAFGFRRFGRYFGLPRQTGQVICWRRRVFKTDGKGRRVLLHPSGRAMGSRIRTPARYVLVQRLVHKATGTPITVLGTWIINSHDPANPAARDATTTERARLAEKSFDIIDRIIAAEEAAGRIVIFAGDLNALRADYEDHFETLHPVFDRGLDRIYASDDPRLEFLHSAEGPKTGVGGQMQHQSRHATYILAA